jgi:hypothetical protein
MHIIITDFIVQSDMRREADISISIVGTMKCPANCLPSDLRPGILAENLQLPRH